jgi:hypothetical protein
MRAMGAWIWSGGPFILFASEKFDPFKKQYCSIRVLTRYSSATKLQNFGCGRICV